MTGQRFDASAHPRTPAGVRSGGQFSTRARGEASITLDDSPTRADWSAVVQDRGRGIAMALHEVTGWPVVTSSAGQFAVRTPNGRVLHLGGVDNQATWAGRSGGADRSVLEVPAVDPPRPTPRSMQLAGQLLAEHSEAATAAVPPIGDCDELTFTAEQCHRLAQALHDASGWEVVVVSDGPHGVAGWVHAGVRTPGGQILDVHGLQDEQLWIVDWAEHCDAVADGEEAYDRDDVGVFPATDHGWTPEHGWALGDSAPLYPDIEKRAAQVASLLLEQYRHAEAA